MQSVITALDTNSATIRPCIVVIMKISLVWILSSVSVTSAFCVLPTKDASSSTSLAATDRRSLLTKLIPTIAILGPATYFANPMPAYADLADGNALPESAEKFKRLLSLKADLPLVISRVKNASSDNPIDKKEWDNLSDFMRRIYKGGEDMKSFAKTGIYDPEKKKKADDDIKALQKYAQAGDPPISKEDADGLLAVLTKCDLVLENFFDLLRDIPDEI